MLNQARERLHERHKEFIQLTREEVLIKPKSDSLGFQHGL